MLSNGLVSAAYIAASVLFILALGGLRNQESAKRAIWYGIIGMGVAIISVFPAIVMITTQSILLVYVSSFFFTMFSSAWVGSCVAMANELVLPRMRAASSAFYIVCATFIGLALGPYTIGRTSDWLSATMPTAEALQTAILVVLPVEILAAIFLWLSSRHVEAEEAQRLDRARAAGESV